MAQNRAACISNVDDEKWKFQYEVLYSALGTRLLPFPVTAPRPGPGEATMEPISGPILYVLIAWGAVTTIFLLLLIWRSVLASHEDDQIFLDAAEEHMAREQRELVAKINKFSRPLMTSGVVSGVLLLVLAGLWLYNGLKNF